MLNWDFSGTDVETTTRGVTTTTQTTTTTDITTANETTSDITTTDETTTDITTTGEITTDITSTDETTTDVTGIDVTTIDVTTIETGTGNSDHLLHQLDNVGLVSCVVRCQWEEQCVSVVHSSALNHCTLHAAELTGGWSLKEKGQESTKVYSVWEKVQD